MVFLSKLLLFNKLLLVNFTIRCKNYSITIANKILPQQEIVNSHLVFVRCTAPKKIY